MIAATYFTSDETENVLGTISAGAAGVLSGGLPKIFAAAQARTHLRLATAGQASKGEETFLLAGDLLVNRLGFGAMRLTGELDPRRLW